jgi:uroporphyrinogen decarboxylase
MSMSPRERVLAAIERRKPDRTPADFEAEPPVQDALMKRLGVATHEELLQVLQVDMRRIPAVYNPNPGPDALGYYRSVWGVRERARDPGDGRPMIHPIFNENTTVDDVHAHPWPDPSCLVTDTIRRDCDQYRGQYALYGAPWVPFFHEAARTMGQENFYVMMGSAPEVVHAVIGHLVDFGVAVTRRFLEAAGGKIDIAYFGNDFGTQRGLVISPAMWQEFIRQPLKRYYDAAHDYGCKVMQHSCGAIRDIIPSLIEDGVDILNPIQVRAAGMEFDGLHRDFGRRVVFYGGVDTQETLPRGSPADVRDQVRHYVATCRNGGYILAGSHVMTPDIPLDNILAMYETGLR